MDKKELEIFKKVREEMHSMALDLGIKYFKNIRSKFDPIFEMIDVDLMGTGYLVKLMDRLSDYNIIFDQIFISFDDFLNPNILKDVLYKAKMKKIEIAKDLEKERQQKIKEKIKGEKKEYERLKRKYGQKRS